MKSTSTHPYFDKLFRIAKKYLDRAHSPYSRVKVASAVLMSNGKVYGGCNIENASYGGTICAERVAITKAVSEGSKKIKAILVVTNQPDIWPPCGMCRQVISEFAASSTQVICCNLKKEFFQKKFSEIFPGAFNAKILKK